MSFCASIPDANWISTESLVRFAGAREGNSYQARFFLRPRSISWSFLDDGRAHLHDEELFTSRATDDR